MGKLTQVVVITKKIWKREKREERAGRVSAEASTRRTSIRGLFWREALSERVSFVVCSHVERMALGSEIITRPRLPS